MESLMDWLLARFKERSTWTTLFTLAATVFGVQVAPELQAEITTAGLAVAAAIGIITREETPKVKKK